MDMHIYIFLAMPFFLLLFTLACPTTFSCHWFNHGGYTHSLVWWVWVIWNLPSFVIRKEGSLLNTQLVYTGHGGMRSSCAGLLTIGQPGVVSQWRATISKQADPIYTCCLCGCLWLSAKHSCSLKSKLFSVFFFISLLSSAFYIIYSKV